MIGNNGTFIGRLAKEVTVNFTGSGKSVATITIYSDTPAKDEQNHYKSEPISITFWGKRAESIAQMTTTGTLVSIEAFAKNIKKEMAGQIFYGVELTAETFRVLESKETVENQRKKQK